MLPTRNDGRPAWLRLGGVGFELLAAIAGFAAVGYWIGGHVGSARWGLVVGALLGAAGGLYNAIRAALAIAEETNRRPPAEERS